MAGMTNGTNGTSSSSSSNGDGAAAAADLENPIESWPKEKKLEKLANYSACQAGECKCFGFKVPIVEASLALTGTATAAASGQKAELCRACSHSQAEHIRQYAGLPDGQLNRFLQTALDVETLFSLICKEEDADSKHIYFFLFKLLRKSILNKESMEAAVEPAADASDSTSATSGRLLVLLVFFVSYLFEKSRYSSLEANSH